MKLFKSFEIFTFSTVVLLAMASVKNSSKLISCDGMTGKKWFKYIGPLFPRQDAKGASLDELRDPMNYELLSYYDYYECSGDEYLCAICAYENPNIQKPIINQTLGLEIYNQLGSYYESGIPTSPTRIIEWNGE